jgi:hypothetical protein
MWVRTALGQIFRPNRITQKPWADTHNWKDAPACSGSLRVPRSKHHRQQILYGKTVNSSVGSTFRLTVGNFNTFHVRGYCYFCSMLLFRASIFIMVGCKKQDTQFLSCTVASVRSSKHASCKTSPVNRVQSASLPTGLE